MTAVSCTSSPTPSPPRHLALRAPRPRHLALQAPEPVSTSPAVQWRLLELGEATLRLRTRLTLENVLYANDFMRTIFW